MEFYIVGFFWVFLILKCLSEILITSKWNTNDKGGVKLKSKKKL